MDVYKVNGESREVGAIGIFEPFIENIAAESSREAYLTIRANLYARNREHVLIKDISLITDDNYIKIEPRAYL